MTERERFRARGLYYYITNDYQTCVKEIRQSLARFEADAAARNNRALCLTKLRDLRTAREEMQRSSNSCRNGRSTARTPTLLRDTSDFGAAEEQALVAQELGPLAR